MPVLYEPLDSEVLVNGETDQVQAQARITRLDDGGFVVVWTDGSTWNAGTSFGIKAQRFDADGNKVGSEFTVNTSVVGEQSQPSVATLADGRYVVSWTDFHTLVNSSNGARIRAQVFEADGTRVGDELLVNTPTTVPESASAVAGLTGGGFVVSWQGTDISGGGIKAQIYDASGAKVGLDLQVNTTTNGLQATPSITALASGGFAVSWTGPTIITVVGGVSTTTGRTWLQLFDAAGNKVGGEQLVNTDLNGAQNQAHVTALDFGLVVTWLSGTSIKFQLFDGNGGKVGGEIVAASAATGILAQPHVDALPGGGFILLWRGTRPEDGSADIHAQLYDAAGARVGGTFVVSDVTIGSQTEPQAVVLPSGEIAIVWSDASGVGGDTSVGAVKMHILAPVLGWQAGSPADDALTGTVGRDAIDGLAGNDTIDGGDEADLLVGGAGGDVLHGDAGHDELWSDERDDLVGSGTGLEHDALSGGAGDDFLAIGFGDDADGGAGTDTLRLSLAAAAAGVTLDTSAFTPGGSWVLNGGTIQDMEILSAVVGSRFADTITVGIHGFTLSVDLNDGDDILDISSSPVLATGGSGNDLFRIGASAGHIVEGGSGSDTADYGSAAAGITVANLGDGPAGSDMLRGIETVIGSAHDDIVGGSDFSSETLDGGGGNDYLSGNSGSDILIGGAGDDSIDGGAGSDRVLFSGNRADYRVTTNSGGTIVLTDTRSGSPDGTDTVLGVERFEFADVIVSPSAFLNRAPSGADAAFTVAADSSQVFTAAQFGFSDPDGHGFAGILVTTIPTQGTLELDGSALSAGTFVSAADIAAGLLVFQPTADPFAPGAASFTFQVRDDGGSFGRDTDRTPNSISFDVLGINDAPTASILVVAAAPLGPQTPVSNTGLSHSDVSMSALADGGYVVTWTQSPVQTGNGSDVYLQRYDAAGAAAGGVVRVNTTTSADESNSVATALAGGGFVVVWESGTTIFAQRFDAGGAAVGGEMQLLSGATEFTEPAVAALSDGGFVVAWHQSSRDFNGLATMTQRFGASGAPMSAPLQVNTFTTNHQYFPSVAGLAGGGHIVTWMSLNQDGSGSGVYARLYDAGGVALSGEFRVNTATANQQVDPAVTALVDGGFVIVWNSSHENPSGALHIYGQRYDASGVAVGGEFRISGAASSVGPAAVTAMADGGFTVSWSSDGELLVRRYDESGAASTPAIQANTVTPGTQGHAGIVGLAGGDFVVGWTTLNLGGTPGIGTFVQHFTDGLPVGEDFAIVLNGRLSIGDPDAGADPVTVTLGVDFGVLVVNAGTSGAVVTDSGTGSVTIQGTVTQINALFSTGSGSLVVYSAEGDDTPPANATLTLTVNDGGHNGTGIAQVAVSTALIGITPFNDAPVIGAPASPSVSHIEGGAPTALLQGVVLSDADAGGDYSGGRVTLTMTGTGGGLTLAADSPFRITSIAENGGLRLVYFDGTADITIGTASGGGTLNLQIYGLTSAATEARLNELIQDFVFGNAPDNPSAASRTITLSVYDGGHHGSGGEQRGLVTQSLNVIPTNDPPEGRELTRTIAEDTAYAFAQADFIYTDAEGNGLLNLIVTTLPEKGTLYLDGDGPGGADPVTVAAGAVIAFADIAAGRLTYVPPPDANGVSIPGFDRFTYQLQDNGGTANGGVDIDPTPNIFTFQVTAVNDSPVLIASPGDASYTENGAPVPVDSGILFNDVDSTSFSASARFSGGTATGDRLDFVNTGAAQFGSITGSWNEAQRQLNLTGSGTVAQWQNVLRAVTYHSTSDNPGGFARAVTFTVQDGGPVVSVVRNVQVTPVPDAPVASDDVAAGTEDVPIVFTQSSLTGNDSDAEGNLLTITGVSNAIGGTVTLGATPEARVTFTPTANFNGTASFVYEVSDGNGGTDTATVTMSITPVNDDPPVATDDAVDAVEDTPLVLSEASLTANDSDADGDALTITGVFNAIGGTVTLGDTPETRVIFTPDPDFAGTASFDYEVSDGHGGTDTGTVTITVAPVNDAPTLSAPTSEVVRHGAGAMWPLMQGVVLGDPDNPSSFAGGSLSLTVSGSTGQIWIWGGNFDFRVVSNGDGTKTLTYQGLALGTISGLGTLSVQLTNLTSSATVERLNELLGEFVYQHPYDTPVTSDSRTVTMTISDGGNTGSGGALLAQQVQTLVGNVFIEGTAGDDLLEGGLGHDFVRDMLGGNDQLFGGGGDDYLYAERSNVTGPVRLDGGAGNDRVTYSNDDTTGSAILIGGDGADRIETSDGADIVIDAGSGSDLVLLDFEGTTYSVALGDGADLLSFMGVSFTWNPGPAIVITDFDAGPGGDRIDLERLLAKFTGRDFYSNPFDTGNLVLVQRGDDAVLQADRLGNGQLIDVIVFLNVDAASLTHDNLGFSPDGSATPGRSFTGTPGDDDLFGTGGDDQIDGGDGLDYVFGGSGDDVVHGGPGFDRLDGQSGDDIVYGDDGDDLIWEQLGGNDQLYGGAGRDSLTVTRESWMPASTILADAGDGDDWIYFYRALVPAGDDLTILGGAGADDISVNYASVLAIDAGAGDDSIYLTLSGAEATITLGAGADDVSLYATPGTTIRFTDFDTGPGGDQLTMSSSFLSTFLTGWNPADNPFATGHLRLAQRGSDTLLQLDGNGGGDSFLTLASFANLAASTFTLAHLGYDPGYPALLGTDVDDNLTGTGQDDVIESLGGNDTVDGGAGNDLIRGGSGNDILRGGSGIDRLEGGAGDDRYFVDTAADLVIENVLEGSGDRVFAAVSYTLAAAAQIEILSTVDNLASTPINLTGNGLAQFLYGNAGTNRLDGAGGGDVMMGFAGDDLYFVRNAGDRVIEGAGEGTGDRVFAAVSWTLNGGAQVEILSTVDNLATTAINLTGNALAQFIYGNAGANTLDGGGGGDVMSGFGGNDFYIIRSAADRINEGAGEGTGDRIFAAVNYTLGAAAQVEILSTIDNLATTAISLTGNGNGQYLYGNAGDNTLDGGGGGDVMSGFGGSDFYIVRNTADRVNEGVGEGTADRIFAAISYTLGTGAQVEMLTTIDNLATTPINLTGNELANTIFGNAGANTLDGKGGADTLVGLEGADTFAFTTALGAGNVDNVSGFAAGLDKVALENAVFTGLAAGALPVGAFRLGTAAQDADDRILYESATGRLFFDADGVGGSAAVHFATLSPGLALGAGDFTVI